MSTIADWRSSFQELIVVVGPTQDDTEFVLLENKHLIDHMIVTPLKNVSVARNLGLKAASQEIILYLDDDVIPSAEWVERHVRAHQEQGSRCGCVAGAVADKTRPDAPLQFSRGVQSRLSESRPVLSQTEEQRYTLPGYRLCFFKGVKRERTLTLETFLIKLTFTSSEIEQLHYERFHHPHPRVQRKMEALYLKSQGYPHWEIAQLLRVTEPTLLSYFQAYQAGGIAQLKELTFYRPQSELKQHQASLEAYFRAHPPKTLAQATAKIEALTGIVRSREQVRHFLKAMGMSCRRVGVIPAKADCDAQEEFLKKN